ncbi:MAG: hypothetical protein JWM19_7831 [Actinomycetia bacterium]|nr:hypothetical protein [Actinomycetes bacterium]
MQSGVRVRGGELAGEDVSGRVVREVGDVAGHRSAADGPHRLGDPFQPFGSISGDDLRRGASDGLLVRPATAQPQLRVLDWQAA